MFSKPYYMVDRDMVWIDHAKAVCKNTLYKIYDVGFLRVKVLVDSEIVPSIDVQSKWEELLNLQEELREICLDLEEYYEGEEYECATLNDFPMYKISAPLPLRRSASGTRYQNLVRVYPVGPFIYRYKMDREIVPPSHFDRILLGEDLNVSGSKWASLIDAWKKMRSYSPPMS